MRQDARYELWFFPNAGLHHQLSLFYLQIAVLTKKKLDVRARRWLDEDASTPCLGITMRLDRRYMIRPTAFRPVDNAMMIN